MESSGNAFGVDYSTLSWGRRPVPLLPRAITNALATEALPSWVVAELGLPPGSAVAALGGGWWSGGREVSGRVAHYLAALMNMSLRTEAIQKLRCFDRTWPRGLRITDIGLGVRAARRLLSAGFIANPASLMEATFGQLLRIEGLGSKTLLEIVCLVDAAIDIHDRTAAAIASGAKAPAGEDCGTTPGPTSDPRDVLIALVEEPWAEQVSGDDPRFRTLLSPNQGSLGERVERIISDPAAASLEASQLLAVTPEIRERVTLIAKQTLEESLLHLLAICTELTSPRLDVIAARLGWNGQEPKTLQECADLLAITRERVRQIEARALRRLPQHAVFLPKLDQALSILENACPATVEQAAEQLLAQGVSRRLFSPASVLRAAQLLGRRTDLSIETVTDRRFVVSSSQRYGVGSALRTARTLAGRSGVASVFAVADALVASPSPRKQDNGAQSNEEDVRAVLLTDSTCEFLDTDWFWFTDIPPGRNRLENVAKKILCVASPQTVASLREGVRRAFLYRSKSVARYRSLAVPPMIVLRNFFRRHPDFRIDGGFISSVLQLNYHELLGEGEKILTDVLRASSSGILDRKSLADACISRGMNENTFNVYTTYSAVLEHLGVDLWKLRGVQVDPAAVEALREQNQTRPRENRLLNFGWSSEGKLWIGWKLPESTNAVVLGIPGGVRRYLRNLTFQAESKGVDRRFGNISVNDGGTSYGYAPFLRYVGADKGDTLIAEFDIGKRVVYLSVGDDAVLEQD